MVTYITGFDVFTDVLLEGKLGTSFVPVVLAKEECSVRKYYLLVRTLTLAAGGTAS